MTIKSDRTIPKTLLFSLSLFGQIGFGVAIPLVALGLIGRYLDEIYSTDPYLFLTGIGLAVIISFLYLKKVVNESIKQAKQL